MEQRDYILIEIEKIGTILRAIRQKIFRGKDHPIISPERQRDEAEGMLLSEVNFDLGKFLTLSREESNEYISSFVGFSVENTELLAEYLSQIGFSEKPTDSKQYLEKALLLYEVCDLKSNTYSSEREMNINLIRKAIH